MKVPIKSISSPGRTDDFPPPLMGFIRSRSKKGSRSRANPMFVRKINTGKDPIPEPSSPKVTCIGQVRVRRLNNKQPTTTTTTAFRRCRWFRWARMKKWSFFRCDCYRKSEKLPESKRIEVNQTKDNRKREIEDVIGPIREILIPDSPPRNAFLLTRSRSAPYRSSSLESKIWTSTMEKTEDDEAGKKVKECESINGNDGKENYKEECSINGVEEFKSEALNLSRCKSEPARTGDKLFMSSSS